MNYLKILTCSGSIILVIKLAWKISYAFKQYNTFSFLENNLGDISILYWDKTYMCYLFYVYD